MRSALRASGASTVLIPSSAVAAVAAASAVALAVAVESDDDVDVDDDGSARANKDGRSGSSVLLLGLAAAVADEGLSALPWPRSAFDDTRAAAALEPAAGGWESKAAVEKAKYLSLGAAGAFYFG